MTCYHPLKGFVVGKTASGADKYKITSYNVDHVELSEKGPVDAFDFHVGQNAYKVIRDFVEIPCGQCIGCRLEYSRVWANRCFLEMQEPENKESYFVTLTYDDEHLPINQFVDKETGVCGDVATLQKRDFQLFMKRLRKNYKQSNKIRFFAAGEYGSTTYRPHYHAILFGLHLDDLQLERLSGLHFPLYRSAFVESCWPFGFSLVAVASWETCAYTARYIMKKQKGKGSKVYEDYNFEPEFLLMSRKPGIGRKAFDRDPYSWFESDAHFYSTSSGSVRISENRYFRKLMDQLDSSFLDSYNVFKQNALVCSKLAKLKQTSRSYLEMLEGDEIIAEQKMHKLSRSL